MKKYVALICVLTAFGALVSCSTEPSESSKKEIVSVDSENSTTESNDSENENTPDEKVDTNDSSDLSIEEQVLWEVDGVKITATGISEDSIFGSQIDVLIENNSDKDVGIGVDAMIVNDFMISDLTSITVTAGNKSNSSISLLSSELNAAGIKNIGKVELYLHTFDAETYMTEKKSDCITLTMSGVDKVDTETNISGTTLYDAGGVKIIGQYVDDSSFWGSSVILYIENNTEKNIIIQNDELAVNGFMVTSIFSQDVYAGKKAIADITLLQSDLDNNGITSIDEIETSFEILDENYSEIANSGKVKFSTN